MKNKKNPACQTKAELMQEIEALQQALETAHSNFENVCDPDLIDSYIYEINALSFRYKYLLRQVQSIQTTPNLHLKSAICISPAINRLIERSTPICEAGINCLHVFHNGFGVILFCNFFKRRKKCFKNIRCMI